VTVGTLLDKNLLDLQDRALWPSSNSGKPYWGATWLGGVERLVGQEPGLLKAKDGPGSTPLMLASFKGHVGVVRCLLDKGAAIDERSDLGCTALWFACLMGRFPVIRLLVEGGADPTIAEEKARRP
jgi:hypothetical protein